MAIAPHDIVALRAKHHHLPFAPCNSPSFSRGRSSFRFRFRFRFTFPTILHVPVHGSEWRAARATRVSISPGELARKYYHDLSFNVACLPLLSASRKCPPRDFARKVPVRPACNPPTKNPPSQAHHSPTHIVKQSFTPLHKTTSPFPSAYTLPP